MPVYPVIKTILLMTALAMALYYDVKEQKIKNFITYPAAMLGLALNMTEHGLAGLGFTLVGWLIPVTVLGLFYVTNIMGAGDIKLFAAIGAIMGLPFTVYSFVYSVFFGGLIALAVLLKRRQFCLRMKRIYEYLCFVAVTRRIQPYCAKNDKQGKFIFSSAIVPGTILHLLLTTEPYHNLITKELGTWLRVF